MQSSWSYLATAAADEFVACSATPAPLSNSQAKKDKKGKKGKRGDDSDEDDTPAPKPAAPADDDEGQKVSKSQVPFAGGPFAASPVASVGAPRVCRLASVGSLASRDAG